MQKIIVSIIVVACAATTTFAQIPNAGFENWTSMGSYSNPDNWDQLNAMTSGMSVYTCTKGTPGQTGTAYIKLVSKNVTGMGVMPGIATTGVINMGNMSVKGGFSFTQRPQSLTGAWEYMGASSADQGFVSVLLTKWNASMGMRDTIATALQTLPGMQMGWVNFTIPLIYKSGIYPDTALIILSSSGATPLANSYLYVDNLAFAGSIAGIEENKLIGELKLFPNPANDKLMFSLTNSKITKGQIEISDIQGRKVKSLNNIDFTTNITIDVADLPKGEYFIKLNTSEGIISKKFFKQ